RLPPRGVRGSVVRVDLEALDVEPGARVVIGRGPDADLGGWRVDEGCEARARRVDHVVSDRLPRGAVEVVARPLLGPSVAAAVILVADPDPGLVRPVVDPPGPRGSRG